MGTRHVTLGLNAVETCDRQPLYFSYLAQRVNLRIQYQQLHSTGGARERHTTYR